MGYNSETKLQKAFNVVIKEFEKYKNNLLGKSMLVIYRDRNTKQLDYIIINFTGSNYYHLTGLVYKEDEGKATKEHHFGSRFYKELEDKKLSIANLKIKDNNTELKIKALPFVTSQYKYSNMTGEFNDSGIKLQLDKVIGNVSTCLGLKQIGNKTFAPASSIFDDTRKFAKVSHQIVAIYMKETSDLSPFRTIKHVAKGHDLKNLTYSSDLKALFSLDEYNKKIEGGTPMTKVYFVRHAQPEHAWEDDRTRPLTEEGRKDCVIVLDFLKDKKIDKFYCSPYKRSMDTIADTAAFFGEEIIIDERLREREKGPGGNNHGMFQKRWADHNYHEEGGESIAMVQKRNMEALHEILSANQGKEIVIGTHGTALSTILNFYDSSFGCEDFLRIIDWMPYVVELDFEGDKCVGKYEHCYVEKEFKGKQRADKK